MTTATYWLLLYCRPRMAKQSGGFFMSKATLFDNKPYSHVADYIVLCTAMTCCIPTATVDHIGHF